MKTTQGPVSLCTKTFQNCGYYYASFSVKCKQTCQPQEWKKTGDGLKDEDKFGKKLT